MTDAHKKENAFEKVILLFMGIGRRKRDVRQGDK